MAGNVQRANIMQGRDGRSKGIGIVLYATVADAQKAIGECPSVNEDTLRVDQDHGY